MNAIQSELKRLLVGKTQTQLASELRVSLQILNHARKGKISPKIVKALGFRKVVTYERVERAIPSTVPEQYGRSAVLQDAGLGADRVKDKPMTATEALSRVMPAATHANPKLTPEYVNIALQLIVSGVGAQWLAFLQFLDEHPTDNITQSWQLWCENASKTNAEAQGEDHHAEPLIETLGKPGELYSHLKPVERGPDLRPAPQSGGNVRVRGE